MARDVDENVIGTKRSAAQRKRAVPSPEALGPPVAYLAVKDGTPVYDRDGTRVGVVEHVMDEGGIFEGLIIHTYPLPGRHLYADANQVGEIHERGVLLSVEGADLHEPRRELGRRRWAGRENTLEARLRRAWDWISAHF
jgi:PRC-barrel domain protein